MPQFVAVGHATLDLVGDEPRPGGAALYAALTAYRLGSTVGVLTSLGPDFPPGALPPEIEVVAVPAPRTTRFRHAAGLKGRALTLLDRAADLGASALPAAWREAELALLCPVANEVDPALAAEFSGAVGAAAQGWLRARDAAGAVVPAPWEAASLVLPHVQALFLSEEDAGSFEAEMLDWFQRVPVGVVTLGRRGALLFISGDRYAVEAEPAQEVDATGAGDVFAAAFLVEYQRQGDPWEAARFAACAAALRVEGRGLDAIPSRAAVEARLAIHRRRFRP